MTENRDINYKGSSSGRIPNNLSSAKEIVPLLFQAIKPSSVIDVGCGTGVWISECKRNGADRIQGIDGEWVLPNKLFINEDELEIYDFENTDKEPQCVNSDHYDMAICLEMAEHVSRAKADYVIDVLTKAADVIYFSAATPYSGGMHHVNECWQSYWISKFKKRGFLAIDYIRPKVWNNKKVCYFYAEESFIFVKKERLSEFPLLQEAYQEEFIADIVHPIHFKEQIIKPTHDWSYLFSMQKKLKNAYVNKIKMEWKLFGRR